MIAKLAAPLGALSLLAACSGDTPREELADVGPCVHLTDAALSIDQARGASTDAVIGEIVLADVVIDGEPQTASQLVHDSSSNVQVDGDSLRCTLPCALGERAGDWQFTASAPGYQDTLQQFAVSYTFVGGCPSRDQGTVVDVFLDEEGFG